MLKGPTCGGGQRAGGGAGAAAQHGGHAAGQGFFDLLRQMKWMWLSMPPAVTMLPSQLMTSVPGR